MKVISIETRTILPPKDDIYSVIDEFCPKLKEGDVFIPRKECPGEHVVLAIKKHTLVPSAGIDESNANGHYILWPKNPEKEAIKYENIAFVSKIS